MGFVAKSVLPVVVSLLSVSCVPRGPNAMFFEGGKWHDVAGPSSVLDFTICQAGSASGNDLITQPIEGAVAPRLYAALGQDPEKMRVKYIEATGTYCSDLGSLHSGNFEVPPRLKSLLKKGFDECKTCNAIVAPVAFIWWNETSSSVRGPNGDLLGSVGNGGKRASGDFMLRVFVFTKDRALVFNNSALFARYDLPALPVQVKNRAEALVREATENFPLQILRAD